MATERLGTLESVNEGREEEETRRGPSRAETDKAGRRLPFNPRSELRCEAE
jgi:hypothetical protein